MKTAISIPDEVFDAAEDAARRLSISRSEFYTKAVQRFLQEQNDDAVTAKLNEVYSTNSSELDPMLHEMTLRSIGKDSW
ncbi:MAG: hypothetical protein H0T51_15675 [Pirellulales bacterium]|nr:hypothetical protein [Pirellulales bacterium]